ncbi:MAG: hypothetical protein JXA87_12260 [Thermoleophilia bacterium]|nr:hypothetical protein [Thermoleophilia bacterium]
MCTEGGGLERDILVAQLTALVNEWDKVIGSASSSDEHETGHRHGMLLCRNHVARLIGLAQLQVEHSHA